MPFSLRKPTAFNVASFIESQATQTTSFRHSGATDGEIPPGYFVDLTREKIGNGKLAFEAAKCAIRKFANFQLNWVEIHHDNTELKIGKTVAIVARAFGLWALNACRVTQLLDIDEDQQKFGFTYVTLPGHVETGEEKFTVLWNQSDGSVYYEIHAVSFPNHFLAKVGLPLTRRVQRRFALDSVAAMRRWVAYNQ